jgi:hypothetical protein
VQLELGLHRVVRRAPHLLGTGKDPVKTDHARHFVFSILRVFGPSTSSSEVDAAGSHYKLALMTREFRLNRN